MNACLAAIGSRGDLQPVLALALELRRRGHVVTVCGPPNFRAWFESHGLVFRDFGADIQAWLNAHARYLSGNPVTILKGIGEYVRQEFVPQFPVLLEAARGSDVIAAAGLAWSAASVGQKLGVPVLNVAYSTSVIPSRLHPPPMVPWQSLPRFVNGFLWWLSEVGMRRTLEAALNDGRRLLELPPVGLVDHIYRETPFALAADAELFPSDPTWPATYSRAGFIEFVDPTPLDPELDAWLSAGDAPIFVGFGSMSGGGTARVQSMLTEALAGLGRRVIVGAGWSGVDGGGLPAGFRVVKEAPHAKLFPRCAVVVHHGGSGTTATALRAGVPQVLLPLILDQFHHAQRLHDEGLAPPVLHMEDVTPKKLVQAIQAALALPEGPRKAAAERVRAMQGAPNIADRMEALAAAKAAVPA